jgi:hypothetical protein
VRAASSPHADASIRAGAGAAAMTNKKTLAAKTASVNTED